MTAFCFVEEFAAQGVGMEPDGDSVILWGAIDDDIVAQAKAVKSDLLQALTVIREKAGEDWPEIAADPKQLKAFASLLMISEMRSRGVAPSHYTAETICKHCGPVPIWEGCPPNVRGCPWCLNRVAGRSVPKARGKRAS